MREIKFRVFDTRHSGFRYWGFLENGTFTGISTGGGYDIQYCKEHSDQSTGLQDIIGIDIYEGDILNSPSGTVYTIEWYLAGYMLKQNNGIFSGIPFPLTSFEIIGNIHENPELLEMK